MNLFNMSFSFWNDKNIELFLIILIFFRRSCTLSVTSRDSAWDLATQIITLIQDHGVNIMKLINFPWRPIGNFLHQNLELCYFHLINYRFSKGKKCQIIFKSWCGEVGYFFTPAFLKLNLMLHTFVLIISPPTGRSTRTTLLFWTH